MPSTKLNVVIWNESVISLVYGVRSPSIVTEIFSPGFGSNGVSYCTMFLTVTDRADRSYETTSLLASIKSPSTVTVAVRTPDVPTSV